MTAAKSSNPRPQGQCVTIWLRLRTRVRFRVPPSRDKWPKRWTLGQNRGHLFGLRSGIESFSVQFPGKFMPSRHVRRRRRLWFRNRWWRLGLLRPTDGAVVLLPLPEGLQREAHVANQSQMRNLLSGTVFWGCEPVLRQSGCLNNILGRDVKRLGIFFRFRLLLRWPSHDFGHAFTVAENRCQCCALCRSKSRTSASW